MKVSKTKRISLISLILFSILLEMITYFVYFLFVYDQPTFADSYHITRLSSNSLYYICDIVECLFDGTVMKYVINVLILSLFLLIYLIVNNKTFHQILIKFFPSFEIFQYVIPKIRILL
jgi:hypothetical protein